MHGIPAQLPLFAKNSQGTEHVPLCRGKGVIVDVQDFQRHFELYAGAFRGSIIQMEVL